MSLARARRASRIITFTSLITGAWFASVRRSEIVSSSSARRTRSLPRRSVACTSGGDSDCADRIAAWISAAGAATSFTRRPYAQQSSSITVGSGGSSATTSSSLAALTPTGNRQCSSRYLGESRCASGPAAAARRSAPVRGGSDAPAAGAAGVSKAGSGFGREAAGAAAWAPISSGRGIWLISGSRLSRRRRRQHAIDLRLQALQPVALALEQGVRLLVGKRDVGREEDGDLGALAGDAVALKQIPEQRQVLEERHPALDDLLRLADQPADHHRVPGLDDRARFRLASRDDGSVLRRGYCLLRQRTHLLQ